MVAHFTHRCQVRLLGLLVRGRAATPLAVLVELKFVWRRALVLIGMVVTPLALFAFQRNEHSVAASHNSILTCVQEGPGMVPLVPEPAEGSGSGLGCRRDILRARVQD